MRNSLTQNLSQLQQIIFICDHTRENEKLALLKSISVMPLIKEVNTLAYHELLLFMATHPENALLSALVEKEFTRISTTVKKVNHRSSNEFLDSGLTYSRMVRHFSHDLLVWLIKQPEYTITIDSYAESGTDLNTILRMTLPSIEQELTMAGLGNEALLDALQVKEKDRLAFLLNEFSQLNSTVLLKDHLWDSLKLYVEIRSKNKLFSRSFNRIPVKRTFFHDFLLKKFDFEALIKKELPILRTLDHHERSALAGVIKKSLALTLRETDPSTYMDENSIRCYELERGIDIAIFGMKANRQMSMQSYIGYSLFKNGFPAAYGGSWVFGKSAMFGLNIFESFRGGESGYIMCQLLRVYRGAFGIEHFEIEPYQYGRDNPDGIKSGAFWFYYRHGFRPVEKAILKLAQDEQKKIKTKPGYKTNSKILYQFTESNLALNLNGKIPLKISDLLEKITKMIGKKFDGNRQKARDFCTKEFLRMTGSNDLYTQDEKNVMADCAFIALALQIKERKSLLLLKEIIHEKPVNPYKYNQLLCEFLDSI